MTFRTRISLVIFIAGLLPTLAAVLISAYLLNSTLDKIGASGYESSLETARSLLEQSQNSIGHLLKNRISPEIRSSDKTGLGGWLSANKLDWVFYGADSTRVDGFSDSLKIMLPTLIPVSTPGMSYTTLDSHTFQVFTVTDSAGFYGCGMLISPEFARLGREFSAALTASASLDMYKQLLAKIVMAAIVFSIIFILIISLIASRLASSRLVRPLRILSSGADAIGAGDLDHRVIIERHDEFSHLADSFNSMADKIKENQRKLLEAERLAAWREVARRIAHEIRNPLTPINIELYRIERFLASSAGDNAESLKSLDILKSQIQVLQEMAHQFSTFAKEPELKLAKCSLKSSVVAALEIFHSQKDLCLTIRIDDNIPPLNLDSQMFSRALVNLVKNSVEASPKNPKVDIVGYLENDNIVLIVRDHGPGFPQEKLDRIDQPYITSKKTGSGLGLAIVKKIIEEHGARVRFFNENGAVVEILFPVKPL
jgi:nitrogen fixation/metabolism regulation signal transduction histidine kinase